MEEHLKQLCNENPLLLTTIQGAIFSGYEQAKRFVIQNGCESIQRDGYARHVCIEPCVFRAIEEARFSGVTLSCPNNIGKTAKHLEIRTPHAILMIASGRNTSKPPKAKYRQQTIDQFYYGQQVLPGVFHPEDSGFFLYILDFSFSILFYFSTTPIFHSGQIGIVRATIGSLRLLVVVKTVVKRKKPAYSRLRSMRSSIRHPSTSAILISTSTRGE